MWSQSRQSERVIYSESNGVEETNTLIVKLRCLFVHNFLVMGLKHTEPGLLKAKHFPCLDGNVIAKPRVIIFVAKLFRQ
jgi:hypothetical protein